jgi:hypothetical protein
MFILTTDRYLWAREPLSHIVSRGNFVGQKYILKFNLLIHDPISVQ